METRSRKILLWMAVAAFGFLMFALWYRATYSMGVARAFDVPGSSIAPRVLLATQASPFKDTVVAGVIARLKPREITVSVVDVSALDTTVEDSWDVIVLVHTWEMRQPPPAVRRFVDRSRNRQKLVDLTTSGDGHFRLEGVDAISSASRDEDVDARVDALVEKIEAVLVKRERLSLSGGL